MSRISIKQSTGSENNIGPTFTYIEILFYFYFFFKKDPKAWMKRRQKNEKMKKLMSLLPLNFFSKNICLVE